MIIRRPDSVHELLSVIPSTPDASGSSDSILAPIDVKARLIRYSEQRISDHACAPGVDGRLGSIYDMQFAQNAIDMAFDGTFTDHEALGNLRIRESLRNEKKHFTLTLAQGGVV